MLEVTVTTETARDRHGDPIGTATQIVYAIGFAPTGSSSTEDQSKTRVDRSGTLYFPADVQVSFPATATFEFREHPAAPVTKWGIDGSKAEWVSPWSDWRPGSEVHVKRVTG